MLKKKKKYQTTNKTQKNCQCKEFKADVLNAELTQYYNITILLGNRNDGYFLQTIFPRFNKTSRIFLFAMPKRFRTDEIIKYKIISQNTPCNYIM